MVGFRWVLLFLAAASIAAGQEESGEVRGRVIDARGGEPLALVQVQLSGTSFSTVTGEDGTFRITGVPAGSYTLQVATVGYHPVHQEFVLAAGETKSFDVVETSSQARRTDSVEVTGGMFEAATETSASAITLQGQERENLASVLADDPLRAVQSLPGVSSNNDFSSEFSLRGAPFDRIGLYLDGVLLHNPFHSTDGVADNGSLTIFNGDMIDDMTLYQGAFPVRYSDRTAGILSVDSRDGNREAVHGQVSASASNASTLVEGPLGNGKRGSWVVSFRKSYLQYILNRIDFGAQAPMAFGFTDGQARVTYDLTTRHNVSLSYLEGASSVDRTRWRDELGVNGVMTSGFRFTLLNLGSRYTPDDHVLITNHLAWSRERGDVANRDDAPLSRQFYSEWTWHGDASVGLGSNNTLEFGGLVRRMRQDGLASQFVYTPAPIEARDLFRGTGRRAGAYAQESAGMFSGKARLAVGLRWDQHSVTPVTFTSPYAALTLDPMAGTRLQLNWGQYAQFPELNQFFSVFALVRPLPERATHYEAAVEQKLDDRTRLRVEFYDRQDRDLLARPALDPRLALDGTVINAIPNAPLLNSERGYARGVEIFLQRRTANGFTGWVSYAYEHTMISDGSLKVRFPSDYDQPHTVNAYISHRLRPTVNLSTRFTYGSGMPLPGFYQREQGGYALSLNRDGLRAPAYQRTDVRLNKAWVHRKTKTTLYAEIVNLTNHTNKDFDTPGPYNAATGRTYPNFFSMFPILPSAGLLFEF